MTARDGVDGRLVVCVDDGDCVAPTLYSKSAYSAILVQSLKSLEIMWSIMSEGRRRRNEAMKYVPGLESVGSRAFICCIISVGFMSPITGN